jgi:cytochrome c oxidase subunit 1
VILTAGMAAFFYNILHSARRGAQAGPNPWDAWTLEWAAGSPPAIYNFDRVPPVRSRRPLWDLNHPEDPDWAEGE